jgi:transcriptional regulator with XRE-family HTH domain
VARSTDPRVHALMRVVCTNLKRFRLLADLTQDEAGRRLGSVTGQQIAKWERGDSWIGACELKLLMDVYQRPVDHAFLEHPPWMTRPGRHV